MYDDVCLLLGLRVCQVYISACRYLLSVTMDGIHFYTLLTIG